MTTEIVPILIVHKLAYIDMMQRRVHIQMHEHDDNFVLNL
jgi:hypothetical protein